MPIKNVFLSSTARDLKEYREAAYRAIEGLDGYHCVRMEDFGGRDYESDEFCRARVYECDLFVGLVGHRYGSCPDGSDHSYTEREYEAAVNARIPRLMFVAPRDFPVPADLIESDEMRKKQKAFRERVSKDRMRADFKSPDDLKATIINSIYNLDSSPTRWIKIPFVIVAMTQKDANDLVTEQVFDDNIDTKTAREKFIELKEKINENGIETSQLISRYGLEREDWIPDYDRKKSIKEIINDVCEFINNNDHQNLPLIQPEFLSDDFFDGSKQLRIIKRLKKSGGILIVDSVTLFHPMLHKQLSESELSFDEKVPLIIIHPVNFRMMHITQMIENEIKSQMKLAYSRFDDDLDKKCHICIADLLYLKRWLFHMLDEAVPQNVPNHENDEAICRVMGKPSHIERLFIGRSGRP